MSDAALPPAATGARGSAGSAIGLVLGAVVVVLGAWAFWVADPPIDRSVIGTEGLAVALERLTVLERPVRGRDAQEKIALSILPLYDNDPASREDHDGSRDLRQELRRVDGSALGEKLRRVPTLVILPKWRLGALARSVFHPRMLLDADAMNVALLGSGTGVARGEPVFETMKPAGRVAEPVTLYAAQTLSLRADGACTPVVWLGAARFARVLVARCTALGATFHVLADPDVANNHGLGVGNNVAFTRALVAALRGPATADVALDLYEGQTFPEERRNDDRGRSWADVLRFFKGPFLLVWLGLGIFAGLALWRGGVRFGAIDRGRDGFHEASRNAMIAADARMLRASGDARPLLARHADDRVAALSRALFGRSAGPDALFAALERRAPPKAEALRALRGEATAGTAPPPAWLARFDRALRAAEEEFRR